MAQINRGVTFTDGEMVTGLRLNNLVNLSSLLNGAITEQVAQADNVVSSNDLILLYDESADSLVKTKTSSLLGSGVPVTASSVVSNSTTTPLISAGLNSDLSIKTYNGVAKTTKNFTSEDGLTVVVTDSNHGLETGMVLSFTNTTSLPSGSYLPLPDYSGTYRINVINSNEFSYKLNTATNPSDGRLTYKKLSSVLINGSLNFQTAGKGIYFADGTFLNSASGSGSGGGGGNIDLSNYATFDGDQTFTGVNTFDNIANFNIQANVNNDLNINNGYINFTYNPLPNDPYSVTTVAINSQFFSMNEKGSGLQAPKYAIIDVTDSAIGGVQVGTSSNVKTTLIPSGIKFSDGSVLTSANIGSGTYARLDGASFTGKVNINNGTTAAPLNIGSNVSPASSVAGDIWIATTNLAYRDSNGNLRNTVSTSQGNTFTQPQIISQSSSATPSLSITQNGNGGGLIITNNGTGESLRVNDVSFNGLIFKPTSVGNNPNTSGNMSNTTYTKELLITINGTNYAIPARLI